MQEPTVTIMAALKSGWALTGSLKKQNLKFSTGWWSRGKKTPLITVTEVSSLPVPIELGYGTIRYFAILQVDIWLTQESTTSKGAGNAKDALWDLREEVRRILKANVTGLTDLQFVILNQPGRPIPELDASPPILRWSQDIEVQYEVT